MLFAYAFVLFNSLQPADINQVIHPLSPDLSPADTFYSNTVERLSPPA